MGVRQPFDAYEFAACTSDREGHLVYADGINLPSRRTIVRGQTPAGDWIDVGWVDLRLIPLPQPPVGHAPVVVAVEVSMNLALLSTWDGIERRRPR